MMHKDTFESRVNRIIMRCHFGTAKQRRDAFADETNILVFREALKRIESDRIKWHWTKNAIQNINARISQLQPIGEISI